MQCHAGGHVISAAVGCAFRVAMGDTLWVAAPLAMATAMLAMQWTRTTHPPGQRCAGSMTSIHGCQFSTLHTMGMT